MMYVVKDKYGRALCGIEAKNPKSAVQRTIIRGKEAVKIGENTYKVRGQIYYVEEER